MSPGGPSQPCGFLRSLLSLTGTVGQASITNGDLDPQAAKNAQAVAEGSAADHRVVVSTLIDADPRRCM